MKISIARLKEIIMEEVARATALEEEDVPGSEGYEKQIEDDETAAEAEKKKRREKEKLDQLRNLAAPSAAGGRGAQDRDSYTARRRAAKPNWDATSRGPLRRRAESLNIEIVDDE
jgi:hypothetical protein